jgi:hypothetical protein
VPAEPLTAARTAILAASADRAAEQQVRAALESFGIVVAHDVELTAGARIVVLISAAAVGDQDWMAAVSLLDAGAVAGARMVPVRVGVIDSELLPPALRDFNWVTWNDGDARAAADLFVAFNSDPDVYEAHRVLATESSAWADAGRNAELLLNDRRRVRQARAHLVAAAQDQVSHVTETMREFVAASGKATGLERRRRIRRWLVRGLVVGIFVALGVYAVSFLREVNGTTYLRAAVDLELNPDNLSREAELASVVLIQGAGGDKQVVRASLRETLTHPWGEGLMVNRLDAALNSSAIAPRKNLVLTADGRGRLTIWNRKTGVATKRLQLTTGDRLVGVDVREDAGLAAVVSADRLWLLAPLTSAAARTMPLGRAVGDVVLSPSVAVAWSSDALYVVDASTGRRLRTITGLDDVLAVRNVAGGQVRALVRRGDDLAILDPQTGRTTARVAVPKWRFEAGALGPDGRAAALTRPNHQLDYAVARLRFVATGIPVSDAMTGIELLDRRHVILASPEQGVRVVELDTGLQLARVCSEVPSTTHIDVVRGEQTVVCANSGGLDAWPLGEILSRAAPPPLVQLSSSRTNRREDVEVRAAGDGRVILRKVGGPQRITYTGLAPRWRVASLHPRYGYVAAGSIDGRVMGFDADDMTMTPVVVWRAPTGLPIIALGWKRGDDLQLYAQTSDDRWWRVPTCIECRFDGVLVEYVRRRLTKCEAADQVKGFSDRSKQVLGIRVCASLPDPVRR